MRKYRNDTQHKPINGYHHHQNHRRKQQQQHRLVKGDPKPHRSTKRNKYSQNRNINANIGYVPNEIEPLETIYSFSPINDGKEVTVYTVGDSSSRLGIHTMFANEESFTPNGISTLHWINYWMGPRLMYSVGRDSINLLNVKEMINPKPDSIIAFSFGQIDARIQIPRYYTKIENSSIKELAQSLVAMYEDTLVQNEIILNDPSVKFMVLSIVPTMRREIAMPRHLRVESHHQMNLALKEMCQRRNWFYFDRHTPYKDGEELLRVDLSDGRSHLMKYSKTSSDTMASELVRKQTTNARIDEILAKENYSIDWAAYKEMEDIPAKY